MTAIIHTYIHTFQGSVSVINTVGTGISHKYTYKKIHSVKYYKHFTKTVLYIILTHKKFNYRVTAMPM